MMQSAGVPPGPTRRLQSWKEIASFFDSDERTVRRWEKERGLPVHRVPGSAGAKVFAYTDELTRWLEGPKADADRSAVPAEQLPEAAAQQWPHDFLSILKAPAMRGIALIVLCALVAIVVVVRFLPLTGSSSQRPMMHAIAVLPLANLTGSPGQDYLAAGMTDELITELARISSLRVVSRTSVQQYAKLTKPLPVIAGELNVDAIVEGSVSRNGGEIKVNVQLLDAHSDRHIWADVLTRSIDNESSMQHELAAQIANQIGVQLTPYEKQYFAGRHAVTPESFEAYLQGRYYWNKRTPDGLAKAKGYFEEAVAKDAKNPLAYAGLADTYLLDYLYSSVATADTLKKARAAASRAIALDDQLSEAHCSMAYALFLEDWDFAGAEKEYRRALALNPNFATAHQWYAELLSVLARHNEAIAEVRKAEELDPFSMIIHHEAGQILQNAREYPQALEEYARAEAIDPGFSQPHDSSALAYRRMGEFDQALKELRIAARLNGDFFGQAAVDDMARAYAKSGKRGFLEQSVAARRFYPHPEYSIALDYAALGDTNRVFDALEGAFRDRDLDVLSLLCSPEFDSLHSDPRYRSLVRRIGMPA
jgi:TolB-like protein/Tfp pilus assembly protein PilF